MNNFKKEKTDEKNFVGFWSDYRRISFRMV
jgi:hypothetical protein